MFNLLNGKRPFLYANKRGVSSVAKRNGLKSFSVIVLALIWPKAILSKRFYLLGRWNHSGRLLDKKKLEDLVG